MIPYLLFIILVFFFGVATRNNERSAKRFLFSTMIMLWIVSSLRAENIGRDYSGYLVYFDKIRWDGTAYFEQGYVIFCRIIGAISGSQVWFAACISGTLIFPLYKYIVKNVKSRNYWICAFVFVANPYMYIQTTFNALRQCCSIGFLLIAMMLSLDKKYIKAFILFFIAISFHRSSFVAVIILPIVLIKWTPKKWLYISSVSIALSLTVGRRLLASIAKYVDYGSMANSDASLLNTPIYLIFIFAYIVFLLQIYDCLFLNQTEKLFVDLYIASLCLLLFAVQNDAFYRVRIDLLYISLPGVAMMLDNMSNYWKDSYGQSKLILYLHEGYYFAFYIGYIGRLALRGDTYYVPFKFFWG